MIAAARPGPGRRSHPFSRFTFLLIGERWQLEHPQFRIELATAPEVFLSERHASDDHGYRQKSDARARAAGAGNAMGYVIGAAVVAAVFAMVMFWAFRDRTPRANSGSISVKTCSSGI